MSSARWWCRTRGASSSPGSSCSRYIGPDARPKRWMCITARVRTSVVLYRELVEQAVAGIATDQQPAALALLDREIDNIRSALRHALAADPAVAVRLAGQLGRYWWIRSDPEALHWLDSALRAAGDRAPAPDRARAQLGRVRHLRYRRQRGDAVQAAETALELSRQTNDHAGMSAAYRELALCASHGGDPERRDAFVEAACDHARLSGDDLALGMALARRAGVLSFGEGVTMLRQACQFLTAAGDLDNIADVHMGVAYQAIKEGRVREASDLLDVALAVAEKIGMHGTIMLSWGNIGLVRLFQGDTEGARDAFTRQLQICAGRALVSGLTKAFPGWPPSPRSTARSSVPRGYAAPR